MCTEKKGFENEKPDSVQNYRGWRVDDGEAVDTSHIHAKAELPKTVVDTAQHPSKAELPTTENNLVVKFLLCFSMLTNGKKILSLGKQNENISWF